MPRLSLFFLAAGFAWAQPEGLWQGYEGEFGVLQKQLVSLAEAIPAEKYEWRPAPGVRTTSEVIMHIAIANHWLLAPTGVAMPAKMNASKLETTVRKKEEVVGWLKESLDAVRQARDKLREGDLEKKVKVAGRNSTSGNMYLRIIMHNAEHLGQLVAYARSMGVTPPWSDKG